MIQSQSSYLNKLSFNKLQLSFLEETWKREKKISIYIGKQVTAREFFYMSFVFLAVTSGSVTVASFVSRVAVHFRVINIPIILLFAAGNRLAMKNSVKV